MTHPIDVAGALSLVGPGLVADVRASGREIVLNLPALSMGWTALRRAREARGSWAPLTAILHVADLRLSIRLRGRVVAEAGPGIEPSRLASWLGLPGLRLRPFKRP